jgi:hypothetical protein
MKALGQRVGIAAISICLLGCADVGDDGLTTMVAALSDTEAAALDACLAEVNDCRENVADREEFLVECRALMECLPDRPEDERRAGADWRAFCEGLEERCMGDDFDEALCLEFSERCDASALEDLQPEDAGPQTLDECMGECMNSEGTDEAICSLRCSGFSNPL